MEVLIIAIILLVPIIVISMLAGIRGAVTLLHEELREIHREQAALRREQAALQRRMGQMGPNPAESQVGALGEEAGKTMVGGAAEVGGHVGSEAEDAGVRELPVKEVVREKEELAVRREIPIPAGTPVVASEGSKLEREADSAGQPERAPSKFAETVEEVIGKIWNWFLVGEEHRSKAVTAEYAIASVWLLRVGMIAVVTGIGFFLKLSIERGWVGEEMRTAMSFLAGAGMIAAGVRMLGKKYNVLGQGFLGGGVAVLYFSAYAASVLYGLVPDWVGFALMALVTVTAGIIAVRADSMTVAVLGLVGGYLSPFFFGEVEVALPVLYAYLLILSLGVLGVAHRRQWRVLHYLAFGFTYVAYFYSLRNYDAGEHFGFTVAFLSLFFVVHSAVVYIYHLSKRRGTGTLDILHLIANAGTYSAAAYFLIQDAVGKPYPALMSLGLAVYFVAHVAVLIRRQVVDRKLMVALIGLAGTFAVWTLPIVFDGASLTIGLALLALLLVWLGPRMASNAVTNVGEIVYGIVLVRLLVFDVPREFGVANETLGEYWAALADRVWTFGVSIGSLAAGFYLRRRPAEKVVGLAPADGNDMPAIAPAALVAGVFYWVALGFGFWILQLEIGAAFLHFPAFRLPALTVLWCVLGVYLLCKARGAGAAAAGGIVTVVAVVLGVAVAKLFLFDLSSWGPAGFVFRGDYPNIHIMGRLLDFGTILVVLWLVWRFVPKVGFADDLRNVTGFAAIGVLFVYLNFEVRTFLHWMVPGFEAGGISILWAVFAIALVVPGIRRSVRGLRIAGLAIFACTVFKVFFSDLRGMDIAFRVIAAVVVGIVLLLGSFAYIQSSGRFKSEEPPGK